jgi:hypothetical protein
MKKLFLPILAIVLFSCSKDDNNCDSEKKSITDKYALQIQQVRDNPIPGWGIDYRKIAILEKERDDKIANACK